MPSSPAGSRPCPLSARCSRKVREPDCSSSAEPMVTAGARATRHGDHAVERGDLGMPVSLRAASARTTTPPSASMAAIPHRARRPGRADRRSPGCWFAGLDHDLAVTDHVLGVLLRLRTLGSAAGSSSVLGVEAKLKIMSASRGLRVAPLSRSIELRTERAASPPGELPRWKSTAGHGTRLQRTRCRADDRGGRQARPARTGELVGMFTAAHDAGLRSAAAAGRLLCGDADSHPFPAVELIHATKRSPHLRWKSARSTSTR